MENELKYEADFIKGFNDGYIIAKHAPELSEQLSNIQSELPRMEGLQQGIHQHTIEQLRDIRSQWKEQSRDEREQDR